MMVVIVVIAVCAMLTVIVKRATDGDR